MAVWLAEWQLDAVQITLKLSGSKWPTSTDTIQ